MAALPLKSSSIEQRAVVRFCGLKDITHTHSEMRPVTIIFWSHEKNSGWSEIYLRYGGAMGRSSVACAAVDFVFLHRAFTNLLKDGTNV